MVWCYHIKVYSYFLFHSWPESQSASVPYSGVRPPWWQHWQSINIASRCEGLKCAAIWWTLGSQGYTSTGLKQCARVNI